MTEKFAHATRAGAQLPPAFALMATLLLTAAWPASARATAALAAPALTSAAADSTHWGWGLAPAPDSSAARVRPTVPLDSAGRFVPAPLDSSTRRGARRAAIDTTARPFEYLWVVRTSLLTAASIDSVVARAAQSGVRGLLVQVVGRGDAWYRSDLLPRPEALPAGDLDPLGRIVERAHAAGLEVHAWMNCMLVWSAPAPPRDPRHVVRAHPDWVARLKDGRRLSSLTPGQRSRLGLEGIFLAPAHPGVRSWLANVAREIVSRYDVDGLQLDYIRQPIVAIGWDPTTRARFALEAGVDPARFNRLTHAERAHVDSAWAEFQRRQVRAAVEEVRDSVRAVRPALALSAAVIADTLTAERNNAQEWRDWLGRGLLDRAFVMCYAPAVQTVLDQLIGYRNTFGADGRVVPGIAVYNTPASTAVAKIVAARELGFPTLAVYSYDAFEEQPGYWSRLLSLLGAGRGATTP